MEGGEKDDGDNVFGLSLSCLISHIMDPQLNSHNGLKSNNNSNPTLSLLTPNSSTYNF